MFVPDWFSSLASSIIAPAHVAVVILPDISAAPFMSKLVPSSSVPVTFPVDVIAPDPIVPAKVAFCDVSKCNALVPPDHMFVS